MRIMSLRIRPVANIFAILYVAFSPLVVVSMLWSEAEYFRLPLGLLVAPWAYFNISFDIQRPTHFLSGVLFMGFASLCYAGTGWITGAVGALCFNFIARRTGGIEASVLVAQSAPTTAQAVETVSR